MKKKKAMLWPVIGMSCSGVGLAASILLAILQSGRGESPGTALVLMGCCLACLLVNLIPFLQGKKKK